MGLVRRMSSLSVEAEGNAQGPEFSADEDKKKCRKGEGEDLCPPVQWIHDEIHDRSGNGRYRGKDDQISDQYVMKRFFLLCGCW